MYLSKVTITPSRRMADTLLTLNNNDVYASHQLLWTLFTEDKERSFIYREDITPEGLPCFFVLSTRRPETRTKIFQIQTKACNPQLTCGQRLGFKARLNPTVCMTDHLGKQKRHDVLMHAKRQAQDKGLNSKNAIKEAMERAACQWMQNEKRLENWGISIDHSLNMDAYQQHQSRKKSGHLVQFSSVDFQGVLTINEPGQFLEHYAKGFGRSKSLGCGLMLIRPL